MSFIRNAWYVAAHAHELGEGLVARTICDEPILMYRTADGTPVALHDRCPHRFIPLSMGARVGDTVQCGYHGLRFDAAGHCIEAPNDDDPQRARLCVRAYPLVERYAAMWLWLGDPAAADESLIPTFHFMSDTGNYAVARGYSHIRANYELLTDNLLDLSHVHYLHPGVHGTADFADFTNKLKIEGETVWSMLWRHHYPLDERRKAAMGLAGDDVEGQGHSRWNAPANLLVDTAFWDHGKTKAEGISSPSAHLLTPETAFSTHYFWASGRTNDLANVERTRTTERGMKTIFETQDGPMCEAQQRALGTATDFLAAQPMILRADAAGVAARRISARLRRAEAGLSAPATATQAGDRDDAAS